MVSPSIADALGGARRERLADQPGFAEAFLPRGRAPAAGELFRHAGAGGEPRAHRRDAGRSLLPRRTGREARGSRARARRRHDRGRPAPPRAPSGSTPIAVPFARRARPRDAAQRPGHRRPDGARDDGAAAASATGRSTIRRPHHLAIEAMKLALRRPRRARRRSRSHAPCPPAALLDRRYLAERAQPDRPRPGRRPAATARPSRAARSISPPPTRAGMMVSYIQSNYMGFGSGVVVPGTGVSPAEPRRRLRAASRPRQRGGARGSARSTRSSPASRPRPTAGR